MDSFRNKLIPTSISKRESLETQEDFCNNSFCEKDETIDCGNCLFSKKFCKVELFNEWKLLIKIEDDE